MMNVSFFRSGLLLIVLSLLVACGSDEQAPEPSAVEAAGKELGQAVSRDLKEEIEQAEAVQAQAQQAAENLDKQIEQQAGEP